MAKLRKLRSSGLISPYGPGALIEIQGEAFVHMDLSKSRNAFAAIKGVEAICRIWRVDQLLTPPTRSDTSKGVMPVMRFPTWLFCQKCRTMQREAKPAEDKSESVFCLKCANQEEMYPMRWIQICDDGHLDDVNWVQIVHSGLSCAQAALKFIEKSQLGASLENLVIKCSTCNAETNLNTVYQKVRSSRCTGRQPWENQQDCEQKPYVALKASSMVYAGAVYSALDIYQVEESHPDWAMEFSSRLEMIQEFRDDGHSGWLDLAAKLAAKAGVTLEDVLAELDRPQAGNHDANEIEDIRVSEWKFFDANEKFSGQNLVYEKSEKGVLQTKGLLNDVIRISRLREIRAVSGFTRGAGLRKVPINSGKPLAWPAIEVFGEGILVRFNEKTLEQWASTPGVQSRASILKEKLGGTMYSQTLEATPKMIALHTLSHLAIRSLAKSSGYDASSLRERLYVADGVMSGVLIYTAAGDADGSLGGLSRQGTLDRIRSILQDIRNSSEWCSLDPVCFESDSQGVNGLNMAACHACSLLPETSCESWNILLDRKLLFDSSFGLFNFETDQ